MSVRIYNLGLKPNLFFFFNKERSFYSESDQIQRDGVLQWSLYEFRIRIDLSKLKTDVEFHTHSSKLNRITVPQIGRETSGKIYSSHIEERETDVLTIYLTASGTNIETGEKRSILLTSQEIDLKGKYTVETVLLSIKGVNREGILECDVGVNVN